LLGERAICGLEKLLELAASAARRIGTLDDPAAGPLSDDIDAIAHAVGELLDNPPPIPVPVENLVDDLCQLISKADALAYAADDLFDDMMWVKDGAQTRRIERLSHLVGAAAKAVLVAMEATDKLANDLSTRQAGA
jgi:hypothetical protein